MAARADEGEIMTLEEVARYLRLSNQTIYKMVQGGEIPGVKIGKEWRFRRSVLDEWLDTAIALSRAGFDLMVQQTWLAARQGGVGKEDLERIVEAAMRRK